VGKKLYVGNLSYNVTSASLEEMFTQFGVFAVPRSSKTATPAAARALDSWKWPMTTPLAKPSRA